MSSSSSFSLSIELLLSYYLICYTVLSYRIYDYLLRFLILEFYLLLLSIFWPASIFSCNLRFRSIDGSILKFSLYSFISSILLDKFYCIKPLYLPLKYDCVPLEYVDIVILLLANVTLFYFVPISCSGETSRLLIYISTLSSEISMSLDTKLCSSDEVPCLG